MSASAPLVARVITRLNVGGPTRHVAQLMDGLDPARFRQVLFTGVADADEHADLIHVSGERIVLSSLQRRIDPAADWRAMRALERHFRTLRPSIVHTHQGKAGFLARVAARRAGVARVIHTYHGHTFEGYFRGLTRVAVRAAERAAARRSDVLIVQAASQLEDVRRHLGKELSARVRTIAPAVASADLEAVPGVDAARPTVRVLLPVRLVPIKDPWLALEVLRRLPDRFRLSLTGDGPLRAPIAEAIAADPRLAGRATIADFVADPAHLYASADLVLLTSASEGTPLCLIEAQIAGRPVVSTDVGAVRSVVDARAGRVVSRRAEDLAAAVVEMAEAGGVAASVRADVAARFSTGRLVREICALYDEVLAPGWRIPER